MNSRLLIPRRTRNNPGWLKRLARWIGQRRRMDALFRFHLKLGKTRKEAWQSAERTFT